MSTLHNPGGFVRGLFLVAMAVIILPCGSYAGDGRELFSIAKSEQLNLTTLTGVWAAPDQEINGLRTSLRLKIENNQVQSSVRCAFQGEVGYSSVTVGLDVTSNTFEILNSANNDVIFGNGYICRAHADKTTSTPYQVRMGQLYVFDQLAFEKIADL